MKTIWFSPTGFVSGDPSLKISYPFVSHPQTIVTCSTPGDLKWVCLGLNLAEGIKIESVTLCYQLTTPQSYISQIRLAEMRTPNQAVVHHDDPTDLQSIQPTCYVSKVSNWVPTAGYATLLSLRLNFKNIGDEIRLGAVGITIA